MITCTITGIRARERGPSRVPRAHLPIGSCAGPRLGPGATRMPDRTAPDPHTIDASPICGALHTWPPLTVQVASQSSLEPLWDQLMRRYHYLGYQKLLGHQQMVQWRVRQHHAKIRVAGSDLTGKRGWSRLRFASPRQGMEDGG